MNFGFTDTLYEVIVEATPGPATFKVEESGKNIRRQI